MMLGSIYQKAISGLNSQQALPRLLAKLFFRIIKTISNVYDPLINYSLKGQQIKLPLSHALPLVLQYYPDYSGNLARLAGCVYAKYPDLKIIDIGANIGDSVFVIRDQVSCPILCIEGDPAFFKILKTNTADCEDVFVQQVFVGENDFTANKELVIASGTAHFKDSSNTNTQFKKLSTILNDQPQFFQAKLLKIDTDGFDLTVIRGSVDFIRAARPVLFFEYDPFFLKNQQEDGILIFLLLQNLGYHSIVIYDNFGRYLITLSLTETNQIADLHNYLLDRPGNFYYDICAVQTADLEIIQQLRAIELSVTQAN